MKKGNQLNMVNGIIINSISNALVVTFQKTKVKQKVLNKRIAVGFISEYSTKHTLINWKLLLKIIVKLEQKKTIILLKMKYFQEII